ncbi:MAG TPA: hypothetical protein VFY14_10355 [Streptomyces sp.]|nr:hypothetical protein [Streptomyces sp.]
MIPRPAPHALRPAPCRCRSLTERENLPTAPANRQRPDGRRPDETESAHGLDRPTRRFRREPHHLDGRTGAAIVPFPGTPRGAAVLAEEEDRFAVVLIGLLGEEPPTDDEGMLAYAESLAGPDVAEVLRTAEPLDEPVRMRFPASVRHHYEKLGRHLDGLLVMGDALCCFNPTYGQGMTTAAQEALLLRKLLAEGATGLPRRFFRAAARIVDTPWLLAASGDLRFPAAEGKRGPVDGLLNRYLGRYRAAASVDPALGTAFLSVAHMVEPPTTLLSPRHALRVLRASRKAAPRAGAGRPHAPTAAPEHP